VVISLKSVCTSCKGAHGSTGLRVRSSGSRMRPSLRSSFQMVRVERGVAMPCAASSVSRWR
jgi:hypothetical protein